MALLVYHHARTLVMCSGSVLRYHSSLPHSSVKASAMRVGRLLNMFSDSEVDVVSCQNHTLVFGDEISRNIPYLCLQMVCQHPWRHMFCQTHHEQSLQQLLSIPLPSQQSWSTVTYDEDGGLINNVSGMRGKTWKTSQLTHGNAIDFQVNSFVVITVESAFANSQSTVNSHRVMHIFSRCGKVFINVVHHRNDSADI